MRHGADSFPPVVGGVAWRGAEIARDPAWRHRFSAEQIGQMRDAVAAWRRGNIDFEHIGPADRLLSSLRPLMEQMAGELAARGFVLLQGVPVEEFSDDEAGALFWAIGSLLGTGVTQNAKGDLICPVTNRGVPFGYGGTAAERNTRGYQSKAELNFHCDPADVVGLLCLRTARQGGASMLTSTSAIYNVFAAEHPEYLERLFQGFAYDRKNETWPGEAPVTPVIPVFQRRGERISSRYARSYITGGADKLGVKLSAHERAALDLFDGIARRDELVLRMSMVPGDIQFLNNLTTVHGRTEFEDWPEPERARFLVRLWLDLGDRPPWSVENEIMRHAFSRFGNLGRSLAEWRELRSA